MGTPASLSHEVLKLDAAKEVRQINDAVAVE